MDAQTALGLGLDYFRAQAAALRPEACMLIDGERIGAASATWFETSNPANGRLLAKVPSGDATDVDRAVISARRAFRGGAWSRLEPRQRMAVLFRFADLIEQHAQELALLDTLDVGKPIVDTLTGDVPATALTFRYFAETIDKFDGLVTNTAQDAFHYILREPLGVVACILPWNYPLLIAAWKIAPALAVGNSVVIKPAQQSPLSATRLALLFLEAGGPPGVLNVVHGDGRGVGQPLALHMDVDKISFTGSTAVGKQMMIYAGQSNMKRVTVETGGKSPQIIMPDVGDLDAAVRYAVTGIYVNKGEMCSAGSRLLVHASLHDEFVDRMRAKAQELMIIGDPLDPAVTMGPLVNEGAQKGVLRAIGAGLEEGAELAFGGRVPPGFEHGAYVEPTLLTGVSNAMRIARDEVFGPVAVVIPFGSEEEAIAIANDSIYGLAAGIWTRDIATAHRMARAIEAGVIWINCFDHGDMTQPWGGMKQSGTGRDKCFETLLTVTQTKSVWVHLG